MKRTVQIGLIGPETKNIPEEQRESMLSLAAEIGRIIGFRNRILVTGGCTGVAAAASEAAYKQGGITVGTPGRKRGTSVPFTTVEICTPIEVGDFVFAGTLSCDSIIVFPGDAGTLAELAIAYRYKIPLVFLAGYREEMLQELFYSYDSSSYPAYVAKTAGEAVELAIVHAEARLSG
ncbi:hypothetical protein C4566_02540 [Candidatus Parcubacteria bacterium]|nr:MAG: hypothetical protein C4566_02540 [Candidatus Parcubacteria bacterium]